MPLIIDSAVKTFDRESIQRGDFVRAQYITWPAPINGMVTAVRDTVLTVLFLPELDNVSNYYEIPVDEVADGSWRVNWSTDLQTIHTKEAKP